MKKFAFLFVSICLSFVPVVGLAQTKDTSEWHKQLSGLPSRVTDEFSLSLVSRAVEIVNQRLDQQPYRLNKNDVVVVKNAKKLFKAYGDINPGFWFDEKLEKAVASDSSFVFSDDRPASLPIFLMKKSNLWATYTKLWSGNDFEKELGAHMLAAQLAGRMSYAFQREDQLQDGLLGDLVEYLFWQWSLEIMAKQDITAVKNHAEVISRYNQGLYQKVNGKIDYKTALAGR